MQTRYAGSGFVLYHWPVHAAHQPWEGQLRLCRASTRMGVLRRHSTQPQPASVVARLVSGGGHRAERCRPLSLIAAAATTSRRRQSPSPYPVAIAVAVTISSRRRDLRGSRMTLLSDGRAWTRRWSCTSGCLVSAPFASVRPALAATWVGLAVGSGGSHAFLCLVASSACTDHSTISRHSSVIIEAATLLT